MKVGRKNCSSVLVKISEDSEFSKGKMDSDDGKIADPNCRRLYGLSWVFSSSQKCGSREVRIIITGIRKSTVIGAQGREYIPWFTIQENEISFKNDIWNRILMNQWLFIIIMRLKFLFTSNGGAYYQTMIKWHYMEDSTVKPSVKSISFPFFQVRDSVSID